MASQGKRIGSGNSKFNTYMEAGANAVFGDCNTFHFGASESSKCGRFIPVRLKREAVVSSFYFGSVTRPIFSDDGYVGGAWEEKSLSQKVNDHFLWF